MTNIIKPFQNNKFFPRRYTVRTLIDQIERDHKMALEINSTIATVVKIVDTVAPLPTWYNEKFNGFVKVDKELKGGYVTVTLFNPSTKEELNITTDDIQYQSRNITNDLTVDQLEQLEYDIPKVECKEYRIYRNIKEIGDTFKVIKGRKFPIETTGVIERFEDYKINGKVVTTYAIFNNKLKVDINNIEII